MKIWENKMFKFWNFGFFCFFAYLRKSNPKLNPQYVGHKFWNSIVWNDLDSATMLMFTAVVDSGTLCRFFRNCIWYDGFEFINSLLQMHLNYSTLLKCFEDVLDTECREYFFDFCNWKYIDSWNRRNLSIWLWLSITSSERPH